MAYNRTLLAHIVPKFSDRIEDVAVEALGYILSESESARHALQNVLRAGGAEVGPTPYVRTQVSGEDGETPDLACRDKDDVERVLIEAKFWAGLTDNQPVAYLERLPTDKPSALIFVAPDARFETLWHELHRQVDERGLEFAPSTDGAYLRSAVVGGERRLVLTSWRYLLDRMASEAGAAGDSRTEIDIRQLVGLTQRMDEDAFLPIRSEELGPEIPRRILDLQRIIDDSIERGKSAGWIDTSKLGAAGAAGGWGRYIRLGHAGSTDRAVALFGYSYQFWAKHRDTPLRLRFYEWDGPMRLNEVRRRLEPLLREDPPGVIYEGDDALVPIYLPVGVEKTAVVNTVFARLASIARMLDQEGLDQS